MRILILLLLSLMSIVGFGQSVPTLESLINDENVLVASKAPTLSGRIINYKPKTRFTSYAVFYSPGLKGTVTKRFKVADNGQFNVQAPYDFPYQEVKVQLGKYYERTVILHESCSLTIDTSVINSETLAYSLNNGRFDGPDSSLNAYYTQYLTYKADKRDQVREKVSNLLLLKNIKPIDKYKKLQKLYEISGRIDQDFIKKYGDEFQWLVTDRSNTLKATDLVALNLGRNPSHQDIAFIKGHSPIVLGQLSNTFYEVLSYDSRNYSSAERRLIEDLTEKNMLTSYKQGNEVAKLMEQVERKTMGMSYDTALYTAGYEWYSEAIAKQQAKAEFQFAEKKSKYLSPAKADLVKLKSQPTSPEKRKAFVNLATQYIESPWAGTMMEKETADSESQISKVSQILSSTSGDEPIFTLGRRIGLSDRGLRVIRPDAKSMEELLTNIRNMFDNQAVILHFWSTQDGRGTNDMRQGEKSLRELEDYSIEVVHFCIDEERTDKQKVEFIQGHNLIGNHLVLNKNLMAGFNELFTPLDYPLYYLIHPSGKIDAKVIQGFSELRLEQIEEKIQASLDSTSSVR